jgi:hypothetical protein
MSGTEQVIEGSFDGSHRPARFDSGLGARVGLVGALAFAWVVVQVSYGPADDRENVEGVVAASKAFDLHSAWFPPDPQAGFAVIVRWALSLGLVRSPVGDLASSGRQPV